LYDGDEAGVKATIRALEILIACNLQVQTLTLPKEHDPDSYVKAYGVKSFREFKETESRDFVNYLYGIESRERDVTSSSFINEYLTNVTKLISLNNDEVQRGIYSSQVSKQLQIPYEIVVSAVSNHTNRKNYIETTQTDVQLNVPQTGSNKVVNYNNPTNYLEPQEKELVRIMLNYYSDGNRNTDSHISILTTLHEELSEYSFSVQHYDKVKSICFNAYKSKSSRLPLDILLDESEEQVKELVLNLLKEKPTLSEKSKDYYSEKDLVFDYDREDSLEKALNLYKLKRIEVLIEENRLKYEGTDDEYEKEMILTTNIKLSEIKKSIAKEYGYVLTPKSFFYKNITID
jgi:DNA primase